MVNVLCVGTLTSCDMIFAGLDEMPEAGKEMFCKDMKVRAGGCAITPVALARLGVDTALLTRLGNDVLGNIVYDMMKSSGMDMSEIILDNGYRTCVTAVLSTSKNRGFATFYDSSIKIPDKTITKAVMNSNYVFSDLGSCLELPAIVTAANKYKRKLLIDTSWIETMELDKIGHVLKCVEVFSPNDMEACRIMSFPVMAQGHHITVDLISCFYEILFV